MFDIEWLSVARSWVVHDGVVHCEVAVRAESVRAMRRNRKSTEAHKPNRDEQVQDKHHPTHGIPSNLVISRIFSAYFVGLPLISAANAEEEWAFFGGSLGQNTPSAERTPEKCPLFFCI